LTAISRVAAHFRGWAIAIVRVSKRAIAIVKL